MLVISFAEIIKDRDADVRVTQDGLLYAVDLVMVMTGKNRDDAGKVIRRLSDDIFRSDLMTDRQSDKGGWPTKLLSFQNAIQLIMVLPGKLAKETRTKFAEIIQRYIAGDQSLIPEISQNATSNTPVAEMARASLTTEKRIEKKRAFSTMEIGEQNFQLSEQLALFNQINLVLDNYNSKKREELEIQKEQNKVLQEKQTIEINGLKGKTEIELKTREANLVLEEKEKRLALDLRKEEIAIEKQLQNTSSQKNAANHKSVRDIFTKNQDRFSVLEPHIKSFIMMAGGKSVDMYRKKYSKDPAKNCWGCFVYPAEDEKLVLEALAFVFRQPKYSVSNVNQQLISKMMQAKA